MTSSLIRPGDDRPTPAMRWTAALSRVARIGQDPTRTLARVVDDLAARYGEAPALIGETETLSFAGLAELSNRYANWALAEGIGPDAVVGLMMENRPALIAAWLGISRIGATAALLGPGLTGRSLAHCIDLVAPSHLVATPGCAEALAPVLPGLATRPRVWVAGGEAGIGSSIEARLAGLDGSPLPPSATASVTLGDRALLIYTSGTTGLPKAAQLSHHRILSWSEWFAGLIGVTPQDRMYDCLPMHHSVGGVVAPGATLLGGGSVVIRRRFSATGFWSDVAESRATLFQYIGELCRYLANAPAQAAEREHRLRLCAGNGLRADVWRNFQDRFAIPQILEFYAATESTVSLYNVEGQVGSIGRVPAFLRHRSPAALIRHDPERGEPLRSEAGTCLRAEAGEVGELVGRIETGDLARRFDGYTDPEAGDRKVLRDVFAPGDRWFLTGDLMRQDKAGFFYFVDRIGETFRWRGENVSTQEVTDAIRGVPGVREAVVYGVEVPGHEGRAGMAALVVDESFDAAAVGPALARDLPRPAWPVFLRLVQEIETTDTFKTRSRALADEGYGLPFVTDPLLVLPRRQASHVPLDPAIHEAIRLGRYDL